MSTGSTIATVAVVLVVVGGIVYAVSRHGGGGSGPGVTCDQLPVTPGEAYEIHIFATHATGDEYVGRFGPSEITVVGLVNDYGGARDQLIQCVLGKGAFAVFEVHHLITEPGATVHTLEIWTKDGEVDGGRYESEAKARSAARARIEALR